MKPGDVVEVRAREGYLCGGGWVAGTEVAVVRVLSPNENLKVLALLPPEKLEDMVDDAMEFCVVDTGLFPVRQGIAKAMGITELGQVIVSKAVLRLVGGSSHG